MGKEPLERKIELKNLLFFVFSKIGYIIIGAVIGAIVLAAIGGYKEVRDIEAAESEIKLSDEEIMQVKIYEKYLEIYDSVLDYFINAPRMKWDADNLYVGDLEYYIDLKNATEGIESYVYFASLKSVYEDAILSDNFFDELGEELQISEEEMPYVDEYVQVLGDSSNVLYGAGRMFSIRFYAEDKKQCEIIANLIKAKVDASQEQAQKILGSHNCVLVKDSISLSSDDSVLSAQERAVKRVYDTKKALKDAKVSLSVSALNYIEKEERDMVSGDQPDSSGHILRASVKYGVIGAFGGAICIVGLLAAYYLLKIKIGFEDDFSYMYNVKELGKIDNKGQSRQTEMEILVANIKIEMSKRNMDKAVLISSNMTEKNEEIADEVVDKLKNSGKDVKVEGNILTDAKKLLECTQVDGVIVIEQSETALYKEVKREMDVCSDSDIKVIGMIIVK